MFIEAQAKMEAVDALKHDQIIRLFQVWDADVRDVASDPGVVVGMRDLANGFQAIGSSQVRSLYLGQNELEIVLVYEPFVPLGEAWSVRPSSSPRFGGRCW